MFVRSHMRCRLLVSALMLFMLLGSTVPSASAQSITNADWFGWGVNVDFKNDTWDVRYVTYVGTDLPEPHVIAENVVDISAQCKEYGTSKLRYPTKDSAYFDGNVYLKCDLPSVRGVLATLNYTPPSGAEAFCPCVLGRGPFWVDGQVRQLNTPGTMPFLDAGDRGVRVSLLVNGGTARTKLEVTKALQPGFISYTSPNWPIDAAGNRTLMGWSGERVITVADHFNWLDYLQDLGWRSFFKTNVSGRTIGYWNEASTTTTSGTNTLSGNYKLGMNEGTLYVGYSPSTQTYFKGEINSGGIDPGCSGD